MGEGERREKMSAPLSDLLLRQLAEPTGSWPTTWMANEILTLRKEIVVLQSAIDQQDAELAQLRAANAWIPVSMPPDRDGDYWVYDGRDMWGTRYEDLNGWFTVNKITHWRPLPAVPEEVTK
jgi:hypothetical protein